MNEERQIYVTSGETGIRPITWKKTPWSRRNLSVDEIKMASGIAFNAEEKYNAAYRYTLICALYAARNYTIKEILLIKKVTTFTKGS